MYVFKYNLRVHPEIGTLCVLTLCVLWYTYHPNSADDNACFE